MADFNLQIEGLDELVANVKKAGSSMESLLYQAMVKSVTLVQTEARAIKNGSFKNQTGNLRRSILTQVEGSAKGKVYVSADAPYGIYVEVGSGPHTISATNKRSLAFKGPSGIVFAKKVNHPGSRPYPFMEPAFQNKIPYIQNTYVEVTNKIVELMAGQ